MKLSFSTIFNWVMVVAMIGLISVFFYQKSEYNALHGRHLDNLKKMDVLIHNNAELKTKLDTQSEMIELYYKQTQALELALNKSVDEINGLEYKLEHIDKENITDNEALKWMLNKSAEF